MHATHNWFLCASGRDKKLEGEAAYRLGLAYAASGNTETALVVSQLNFMFMCVYVCVCVCAYMFAMVYVHA